MSYLILNESFKTGLKQAISQITSTGNLEKHHNNKNNYFDQYYDFEKAKSELKKCIDAFIKQNNHFVAYKDQHHADAINQINKRLPSEWQHHPTKEYFHKQSMDIRSKIGGSKLGSMTIMKRLGENIIYITFDDKKIYQVKVRLTRVKLRPGEVAASMFEESDLPGAKEILMKYKKK